MRDSVTIEASRAYFDGKNVVIKKDAVLMTLYKGGILRTISVDNAKPSAIRSYQVEDVLDGEAFVKTPECFIVPMSKVYDDERIVPISIESEDVAAMAKLLELRAELEQLSLSQIMDIVVNMGKDSDQEPKQSKPGKLAVVYGFDVKMVEDGIYGGTNLIVNGTSGSKPIPVAVGSSLYFATPSGDIKQYEVTDIDNVHITVRRGNNDFVIPCNGRNPIINHLTLVAIDDATYEQYQQANKLEQRLKDFGNFLSSDDVPVDKKLERLHELSDKLRKDN